MTNAGEAAASAGVCEALARGRLGCHGKREKHKNEQCGEPYEKSCSEGSHRNDAVGLHRWSGEPRGLDTERYTRPHLER
jgi:hypothetical protein